MVNRQIGRRRAGRWNAHGGFFSADARNGVREIGDNLQVVPHAPVQGQIGPQLPRVVQEKSVVVIGEEVPERARETRLDQIDKLIEAVPVLPRFCIAGISPAIQVEQPVAEDNVRGVIGATCCAQESRLSGPGIDGAGVLIRPAGIDRTPRIILNGIDVAAELERVRSFSPGEIIGNLLTALFGPARATLSKAVTKQVSELDARNADGPVDPVK